jgi:8-oxo-dGTP pyrophosphatase MutT (NUDIX family)
MDMDKIKEIFKNRKSKPLEIKQYYSVLLPLIYVDDEIHILYEVRSQNIKTQPGEISFPGGKVEVCEDFKEAAIRETYEEIGIDIEDIEVIGELDYVTRENNFILYPYIGILHTDINSLKINEDEVEKIFTVPIKFFVETEPEEYNISFSMDIDDEFPFDKIPNGQNYNWRKIGHPVLFYDYNGYIIWGMTAKMTENFIKRVKKGEKNV